MAKSFSFRVSALLTTGLMVAASLPFASAASDPGYFMPPTQAQKAPQPRHEVSHNVQRAVPVAQDVQQEDAEAPQAPPILPLPPVPTAPVLGKEAAPPQLVIGIISVQGVMMLSSAAQEIQQVLGQRRDALAREVQKEEASWRAEQQKLQVEARNLTAEQIQKREKHLQERRAKDQRDFGNRARIMQEAYQVAFHQIERVLEQRGGIIANVAGAHGMNLVLHAEQVVLHVDGQDITEEVAAQLNKVLPHVFIPADGVDPEVLAKSGKMPTTADEERLMSQEINGQAAAQPAAAQNKPVSSVVRQK